MFRRTVDGLPLKFHLAGINNQNFLMRDEQTGTYWQQITGLAVSGPLAGRRLQLVHADELTFGLWKREQPGGTVLNDVPNYVREYAPKNWDRRMAKAPTVISYAQAGLKPRDLMLGVHAFGCSRAFPYEAILKEKLIVDHVGSEPVMVIVGPDNRSVRVFHQRLPGVASTPQFYRISEQPVTGALLLDATTGSQWNFEGCAVAGRVKGACLQQVEVIKDYWFDWRNYHPDTTVYGIRHPIQ
ncbi:MAG: DUF3179 domain-containing protein [Acidobacteriaceae bacterium]|nr:DUF3179 domain-containing protein [Acidobacteriaceae bacterium]